MDNQDMVNKEKTKRLAEQMLEAFWKIAKETTDKTTDRVLPEDEFVCSGQHMSEITLALVEVTANI